MKSSVLTAAYELAMKRNVVNDTGFRHAACIFYGLPGQSTKVV